MIAVAPQIGDDRTLEEHKRPVGDSLHLLGIARHDEASNPASREGLDLSIDVDAGADIDALRRLDQQQHAAVTHQPASQHDLLLVSAAEDADGAGQHGRRDLDLAPKRRRPVRARAVRTGSASTG